MARIGYARISSADQDLGVQLAALRAAGCSAVRAEKVSGASTAGLTELAIVLDFVGEGDSRSVRSRGSASGPILDRRSPGSRPSRRPRRSVGPRSLTRR